MPNFLKTTYEKEKQEEERVSQSRRLEESGHQSISRRVKNRARHCRECDIRKRNNLRREEIATTAAQPAVGLRVGAGVTVLLKDT